MKQNLIEDRDNDCGLYEVACCPCLSPSNKGSLSLTGQEPIWKNAFSFVAQQSLSLMKSRKKSRMIAKEENEETKKKEKKKTTTTKEFCRLHSFFQKENTSGVVMKDCSLCCVDFFHAFLRL